MSKIKIGKATIYHGDCRDVLRRRLRYDHCFMDPPYEETIHRAKKPRARKLRTDAGPELKALEFGSVAELRPAIMPLIARDCPGWMIAFCTPEGIAPWRDAIEAAGARYKRACFWHKPDAAPQFNGQGPGYAVEPFVLAWCGTGFSKWRGGGRGNYFRHNTNNPDRHGENATEKPVALMMELIELFTREGQTILDPCMGSGTTAIAALALGRRFIGIDADERSVKITAARIRAMPMGRDEARRYITRELGDTAPAGPLFEEGDGKCINTITVPGISG